VPYLCRDIPCCRHRPPDALPRGARNGAPSSRSPSRRAPVTRRVLFSPFRLNGSCAERCSSKGCERQLVTGPQDSSPLHGVRFVHIICKSLAKPRGVCFFRFAKFAALPPGFQSSRCGLTQN
jgi:hypothetical protein